MFPFLAIFVGLLIRLGKKLSVGQWTYWLLPVVLLDPVVAGQAALVSPDVLLMAFFLMAVIGLPIADDPPVRWRRFVLALGVIGLCAVSMRGMMTAAALFAYTALHRSHPLAKSPRLGKWMTSMRSQQVFDFLLFAPGFLLGATFLVWHQRATGWTGFHPQSPWAGAFERVDAAGLLRNAAILGWRFADFGRIIEWALLGWLWFRHRAALPYTALVLVAVLSVFLLPSALVYQGLSAHRYFLPVFLALHLLTFQWLCRAACSPQTKTMLLIVLSLGLATGNRWIYPTGISMDWDATLAHQPYHQLRADAVRWLDREKIDFARVGSNFPNLATGEQLCLDGDPRCFAELDYATNQYVFASNIFNDLQPADYRRLESEWHLRYFARQAGVWVAIYER